MLIQGNDTISHETKISLQTLNANFIVATDNKNVNKAVEIAQLTHFHLVLTFGVEPKQIVAQRKFFNTPIVSVEVILCLVFVKVLAYKYHLIYLHH